MVRAIAAASGIEKSSVSRFINQLNMFGTVSPKWKNKYGSKCITSRTNKFLERHSKLHSCKTSTDLQRKYWLLVLEGIHRQYDKGSLKLHKIGIRLYSMTKLIFVQGFRTTFVRRKAREHIREQQLNQQVDRSKIREVNGVMLKNLKRPVNELTNQNDKTNAAQEFKTPNKKRIAKASFIPSTQNSVKTTNKFDTLSTDDNVEVEEPVQIHLRLDYFIIQIIGGKSFPIFGLILWKKCINRIISVIDVHKALWVWYSKLKKGKCIRCTNCDKWRPLPEDTVSTEGVWFCWMATIDGKPGSCEMPSNITEADLEDFSPGDVVAWLGEDSHSDGNYRRIENEHEEYHVTFFGPKPTRSWIRKYNIVCYGTSNYESLSKKIKNRHKKKGKRLQQAIQDAEEANNLSMKARVKKFGFLSRWKGSVSEYVFKQALHVSPHVKKGNSGTSRSQNCKSETTVLSKRKKTEDEHSETTVLSKRKKTEDEHSAPKQPAKRGRKKKVVKEPNESANLNNKAPNSSKKEVATNGKEENTNEIKKDGDKPKSITFNHNNKDDGDNEKNIDDGEKNGSNKKNQETDKEVFVEISDDEMSQLNETSDSMTVKLNREYSELCSENSISGKEYANFIISEDKWLICDPLDIKMIVKSCHSTQQDFDCIKFNEPDSDEDSCDSEVKLSGGSSTSKRGIFEKPLHDRKDINNRSYSCLRVSKKT
ncbi:hypothetical protein CEXT_765682 [Caerostris extrusa]|uniref:CW-type domain-containing protein n=1 Tax=Caerostris extrusa TaxID=172846 RepID=A0AAV4TXN3_CAEEX|nr:hypothetical protein CEXT_765682 [Caerostris extrusa]